MEQSSGPTNQDPFENVQVELGVDGSGSMLGYVNQRGSRYAQTIDSLSTLLSGKAVPTRYWRIGRGAQVQDTQALSPTEFLKARNPEFYSACEANANNQTFPCVSSTLEQIYDISGPNPKQDTLRILLTDLEPDNAAVGQLSGRISNLLKKNPGYKAMLVGVRSQYNGAIFLADTGKAALRYDTTGKNIDRQGRPFYVLITGPSGAVDALVERFQKLPLDVNQAIRASSFALDGSDTLAMDRSQIPDKLNPCIDQAGAINRQKPRRDQQEQWLLLEQTCDSKPLQITLPSQSSIILAGSEQLRPQDFTVSNQALQIDQVTNEQGKIVLNLTLDGSKFAPKKGEIMTIDLKKRALDRATWQGWHTDVSAPNGAKTQNLNLFIGGLRDAVESAASKPTQKKATEQAVKYCLGFTRFE
ncbi:hypothetical protein [Synechocystis sp. LKSZ1]|uniref:hypothetical protein n=1 Tax=Synechocystis sp. LKSZ1 TaxID=3144951 RepID=UPI00336C244E